MSSKKQLERHLLVRLAASVLLLSAMSQPAGAQTEGQAAAERAIQAEKTGDFSTAIVQFRQAIRDGVDGPEIRTDLGIAYFQTGDNSAALGEFGRALAVRPQFLPANLFSGLALLKLQRPKEAISFLEKAHALQPSNPDILLPLARANVASNHITRANALYRKASAIDPQNAEAWFGVGITERVLAEMESKSAKSSGALKPGSPADQKINQLLSDSAAALQKGAALDPDSVRAEMVFAESFRIAERYDDAIREYRAITERHPGFAPAWAGLAAAYSASGDSDKAMTAAQHAIALDPNDADSNLLIAAMLLRAGNSAKAKPYAERATELQPSLSAAHLVLAKVYIAEQNPSAALPELERAAAADTDGSAYYLLAVTLKQFGRTQEAAAAMRKFRELHRLPPAPH